MDEEIRHELGAHYTSIPNIMKVINPLFMDDLKEELEKCKGSEKKLKKLQQRISKIKIFDPACGSGNFLIIAYKELRHLEMSIIEEIGKITGPQLGCLSFMTVDHFYGIEINPFAVELAKLSIWLAEHQMNMEFQRVFRTDIASIPLKNSARIVAANACRIDWEEVCPKGEDDEIYILGNPPYLGQRNQKQDHIDDLNIVFNGMDNYKRLDYISCFFYLAAKYIDHGNISIAFVTTNSISQGVQVEMIWEKLFDLGIFIDFCYGNFKWKNNASDNAGVTITIIGLSKNSDKQKYIYHGQHKIKTSSLNAYLVPGNNKIIKKQKISISNLPKMINGNQPREGGYLLLDVAEKDDLVNLNPKCAKFLRKVTGSNELINSKERWCIWIDEGDVMEALDIPEIQERVAKVKSHRENGNSVEKNFIKVPYRFATIKQPKKNQIVVPTVSSERREYIPSAFLDNKLIVLSSASTVFDPEPHIFAIINSKIHMAWVKVVSGRMRTDIRYTAEMSYNTFPVPKIKGSQKEQLEELSFNILEARDMHPGKTLAQLYDPDKMPQNLRDAHHELDLAVDAIYRKEPFKNDEERLAHLFKLYEKMTSGEKK